jgi:glycosyltransferase involved in cell wall biosynthesis
MNPEISIVSPVFNEEDNVLILTQQLKEALKPYDYEIIYINDGSSDHSFEKILELCKQNDRIKCINFSRNFGHMSALRAGVDFAKGKAIISMDSDLQHPVRLIDLMISKWKGGFDIVYTKRLVDKRLPIHKKITSILFYKLINGLSDIHIEDGAADFRLIDQKVAEEIRKSKEKNIFFRGYISWMGFKQFMIEYSADERKFGKTKYSVIRMFNFALNGITSFSIRPLRFSVFLGVLTSFLGFMYALYVFYLRIFTDTAIAGWSSILVSVLLIGGVQLIILGIIGEYLGKLFLQAKNRPDYIINGLINIDTNER